jgi:hypothetical protein
VQAGAQAASPTCDRRLPALDEHSETPLATATIQEPGAQVEAQVETQTASPSHDGRLEEPETCEAGSHPKVQHQPNDTVSGPVSERPFRHERAGDRPAGCTEGAKLLHDGQNDADARQDFPNEIDDSPPDVLVMPVRKPRMEDDAAAEKLSARRKLRQSPSKARRPGFISWTQVSLRPDATDSGRGVLEQVEDMCRKDGQARSKKLRRVQKEIRSMQARLRDLLNEVGLLEEQEEDARKQRNVLWRLSTDHLD